MSKIIINSMVKTNLFHYTAYLKLRRMWKNYPSRWSQEHRDSWTKRLINDKKEDEVRNNLNDTANHENDKPKVK